MKKNTCAIEEIAPLQVSCSPTGCVVIMCHFPQGVALGCCTLEPFRLARLALPSEKTPRVSLMWSNSIKKRKNSLSCLTRKIRLCDSRRALIFIYYALPWCRTPSGATNRIAQLLLLRICNILYCSKLSTRNCCTHYPNISTTDT